MKGTLKFLGALVGAALVVWIFRALAFTMYTVEGDGLEPTLMRGDRILVSRWSYGLRTGSRGGPFGYGRICFAQPQRGDIVAFDHPTDSVGGVLVCRCRALPGDTLKMQNGVFLVPGLSTCAKENYYWMESLGKGNPTDSRTLGPIPESCIIGRVVMVVYNHDDAYPIYDGYLQSRFLLLY